MTTNELNKIANDLAYEVGIYPNGPLFSEKYMLENTYIHADAAQISRLFLALKERLNTDTTQQRPVSEDQLTLW